MESSETPKSITEISTDLIFRIDLEGKITYRSNLLESLFGYSFGEREGGS